MSAVPDFYGDEGHEQARADFADLMTEMLDEAEDELDALDADAAWDEEGPRIRLDDLIAELG